MDENLINRIISVAYNDASFFEKQRIYKLAENDPNVKKLLEQHRRIADQSHRIKIDDCPDYIVENIKQKNTTKSATGNSLFFDIYSFVFRRPAVSASILSLFVLALISSLIIKRPEIHQQYSKQEIELADQQVKHSLALIAGVFKKTSNTVENDILTERVSRPIKESFNLVNDYLQGEDNENIN